MKYHDYVQWATDCVRIQTRRLSKELRGGISKNPVASIHKARVACRRLLVMLWFFNDLFPRSRIKRIKKELRRLIRKLGRARDVDVQRTILESWSAKATGERAFEIHAAAARWAAARQKLRPVLKRVVREFNHSRALDRVEISLRKSCRGELLRKKKFPCRAAKKLGCCLDRIDQRLLPDDDTALLHALRSRIRKLRYTLELCGLEKSTPREHLSATVRRIQDVLGRLHDYDMLRAHLAASGKAKVLSSDSRRLLMHRCAHEHQKLYHKFTRLWREFQEGVNGQRPKAPSVKAGT